MEIRRVYTKKKGQFPDFSEINYSQLRMPCCFCTNPCWKTSSMPLFGAAASSNLHRCVAKIIFCMIKMLSRL
eukprot:g25027.t1